jgi:hypothetical protein
VGNATVFTLFAEEAAAGVFAFLPLVTVKEGGRRFFEVCIAIGGAALALGEAVRLVAGLEAGSLPRAALALSLAGLGLALLGLKVLRGPSFDRAKPWLGAAGVACAAALVCEGVALDAGSPLPGAEARTALTVLSLLAGAALTGSVVLSMTLGHFYLVIPRLTIDPLRRLTNGYLGAIVARVLIALAATALAWEVEVSPGRSLFLDQAALIAPRVLFGLAGPLLLCFLARGTVAIKSTQSATGILYGATVLVVFGELAASWLVVNAHLML